jgi:hypothetical protein
MSGAICNLAVVKDKRVRRTCPRCKRREMATCRVCYDGLYLFFDCGVTVGDGDEPGTRVWWKGPRRRGKR